VPIRLARLEDAERVAELSGELGYPRRKEDVARRLRALARERDDVVWVAEDDSGRVVGFLHACARQNLIVEPSCEIAALVVDESRRGQGVGRALMAHAEAWARSRGLTIVMLRSRVERTQAHAFYERLGYELLKTQRCFRRRME
jgi:GNAT superfamily N-acetyltransferase